MATLQETFSRADAWIATTLSPIQIEQQSRGSRRFLQLPPSHITIPAHTATRNGDVVPDNLSLKRGDKSWQDVDSGMAVRASPVSTEVHEYQGPKGLGYIVIYSMQYAGEMYQRQVDYGPEKRSSRWAEVIKEDV